MAELPEVPIAALRPKVALWKRVLAWSVLVGLYAASIGMAGFGVRLILHGLRPGIEVGDRLGLFSMAAGLLVFPVALVSVFVRTKLKSGRWAMSKKEAMQRHAQCAARRVGPMRTPPWSFILFAVHWSNFTARDERTPAWKRAVGWTLLVLFGATLLGMAAFGVIFIGAGLDTFLSLGWMMMVFGLMLWVVPVQAVRACLRRRRETGSLRTSEDELAQLSVQRTVWEFGESQKPLRSKVISTVLMAIVLGVFWMRSVVYPTRHSHPNWVTPGMWTLFAAYVVWVQFRKPKASRTEVR